MVLEPTYIEPTCKNPIELVKYEQIIGDVTDTSCESVAPTPPPRDESRRISFLVQDKEDNSQKSEDESLFNISVNHSILSEKFCSSSARKKVFEVEPKHEENLEPLFTINISIKNERNGVLIHRKFFV